MSLFSGIISHKSDYYLVIIEPMSSSRFLLTIDGKSTILEKCGKAWVAKNIDLELCQKIGQLINRQPGNTYA